MGDKFYMIEEGELFATKTIEEGSSPTQVYIYKSGDYFGELSLIRNVPRQANVIAKVNIFLISYISQMESLFIWIKSRLPVYLGQWKKFWWEMHQDMRNIWRKTYELYTMKTH